jgi:S-DNA-T family DNA segregation ATPase FtsK/SpoIIIE
MSRVLHFQADRIELLLASHKVPARVTGGTITPRLVRFHVSTPLGVKVRQLSNLSEEIALSLGASSCRVYRQDGQVEVEVPRRKGTTVRLMPLCRRLAAQASQGQSPVPPLTAVLGLDQEGMPVLLQLPSPNVAHVLIAGTTGSGKTALARSIVASLALLNSQRSLQLVLIDPKGRGFLPFEGLPHLLVPVVTRVDEALPLLQRLVEEMERRDAERRSEPRLVVVLDELADLMQVGGREMEAVLTRLTQRGREAGLHLVACTQKPAATVIGGLVKSNFPVRLVGSVASPEDAKVATGLAGTGAERLLGQGDFLVVAKGQVTRLQAAYLDVSQLCGLVRCLQVGSTPLLPSGERVGAPDAGSHGLVAGLVEQAKSTTRRITQRSVRWD